MLTTTMMRLKRDLQLARISHANFAFVLGVPASTMRLALIGQTNLGGPLEAHYAEMASRCRAFVEALGPLHFHEWGALKKLIEENRSLEEVKAWREQMFPEAVSDEH